MLFAVPCPTCGMAGSQPCIRGRKYSSVWMERKPYPEGHDSRRTAEIKFWETIIDRHLIKTL